MTTAVASGADLATRPSDLQDTDNADNAGARIRLLGCVLVSWFCCTGSQVRLPTGSSWPGPRQPRSSRLWRTFLTVPFQQALRWDAAEALTWTDDEPVPGRGQTAPLWAGIGTGGWRGAARKYWVQVRRWFGESIEEVRRRGDGAPATPARR